MKVSVITAVRNGMGTIADTICSIQEQRYPNIEHVVVDGASSDGTADMLLDKPHRNRIVVSERDQGIYDALNKGMKLSTGDVIGVLHSDDVFHGPAVVSKVVSIFQREEVDLVYGDIQYVRRNNLARTVRFWKSGEFDHGSLRYGWMPPHTAVFFRRRLLESVGGYDTSLRIAADYDLLLRVLMRPDIRVAYLPEILVRMRTGGISNGSVRGVIRKSREDLHAARRNGVGGRLTLLLKNLRKLPQFVARP